MRQAVRGLTLDLGKLAHFSCRLLKEQLFLIKWWEFAIHHIGQNRYLRACWTRHNGNSDD